MPIQFPLPSRGPYYNQRSWLMKSPFDVGPAGNLARPGFPFTKESLHPGLPRPKSTRPNLRELGRMYRNVQSTAVINPENTVFSDGRVFDRVMTNKNLWLSGVSRDNTGAALGNCRVLVFRSADNLFITETLSDGSGLWSVAVGSGPFFLVEYKAGAPDVAGTSVNTLIPV